MNKIKFYLCHSIRGAYGDEATMEQMYKNCQQAIKWAEFLRDQLPGGIFYCPAEFEELFGEAWDKGLITSKQILHQSKAIVRMSDVLLIMTDPKYSGGIRAEMNEANKCDLPMIPLFTVPQSDWPIVIVKTVGNYPQMDVNSLLWTGPQ